MATNTKVCPNCGTELIKEAKFCRICGTKVDNRPSDSPERSTYELKPSGDFEPVLNDDMIRQLSARQRLKTLDKEKNEILQQVEILVNKSKAGLIEKDEAKEKITAAKQKINQLNSEKKQLLELADKTLEVETLYEKFKELSEKLKRLNEMKRAGTIKHPDVHAEMVRKYQVELNEVRQQLDSERQQLQYWMATLREELRQQDKEIERIQIQAELGELSREEANKKEKEIRSKNEEKAQALRTLEEIYHETTI